MSLVGGHLDCLLAIKEKAIKIAVDFDGTCVDHRYPDTGKNAPWAVETLHRLVDAGHQLILYTMRSGEGLENAIDWFHEHGIKLYGIQLDPEQGSWSKSNKCYAQVYIDDAAFGCPKVKIPGFARPCVDWIKVKEVLLDPEEEKGVMDDPAKE